MKKEELLKNIENDLKSGISWGKIMKKYDLKSDYLIRQVKGNSIIRHEDYNYIGIQLNFDSLKKLDDDKFTTIYAYFKNANRIIRCKSIDKLINLMDEELRVRDERFRQERNNLQ